VTVPVVFPERQTSLSTKTSRARTACPGAPCVAATISRLRCWPLALSCDCASAVGLLKGLCPI